MDTPNTHVNFVLDVINEIIRRMMDSPHTHVYFVLDVINEIIRRNLKNRM